MLYNRCCNCNQQCCCDNTQGSVSITVGSTITGPPGSAASVTNSGTSSNAVLNFTIPAGLQGLQGPTGSTGPQGLQGPAGSTGPQGPQGNTPVVTVGSTETLEPGMPATVTPSYTPDGVQLDFGIPRGETGTVPDDIFASFFNFAQLYTNGSLLPFYTVLPDTTGNIVLADTTHISLEPGYYQISYHVSALFSSASYMQITPSYNGSPHIEFGIYFMTSGKGSAYGSNTIIISVPAKTVFTLTYNSPLSGTDGTLTLSFIKLKRS